MIFRNWDGWRGWKGECYNGAMGLKPVKPYEQTRRFGDLRGHQGVTYYGEIGRLLDDLGDKVYGF